MSTQPQLTLDDLALLADFLDPEKRRSLIPEHPVMDNNTVFITETTRQAYNIMAQCITTGSSGRVFHGPSGVGKTSCILALQENVALFMPRFLFLSINQHTRDQASIKQFYTKILIKTGHTVITGETDAREARTNIHLADQARRKGASTIIFVYDEAQAMRMQDFNFFKDQINDLQNYGVKVLPFLFGESPKLEEKMFELQTLGPAGLMSRFGRRRVDLRGLTEVAHLREILEQFDTACWPRGSDWTYTRFFVPESWEKGFRMASQADIAWETLLPLCHLPGCDYEMAARSMFFALRAAMAFASFRDGEVNPFSVDLWQEAAEEGAMEVADIPDAQKPQYTTSGV